MKIHLHRPGLLAAGLIFWLGLVGAGLTAVAQHAFSRGAVTTPSPYWPATSSIQRSDTATLLVFVHPLCPCSRATINELHEIARQSGPHLAVQIVFVEPTGLHESAEGTPLWSRAAVIPGAALLRDQDGREAAVFGVLVSGEARLYAADGKLLFRGGLTASRGHEGASAARTIILAAIREQKTDSLRPDTAVFGCSFSDKCIPEKRS